MKLIVCTAKNKGMTFLGKRVSKDSVLREKILKLSRGHRLLMNSYSAKQFEDISALTVDENFLNLANDDDFCFIENVNADIKNISELYIFSWNRDYPADFFFDIDPKSNGFKRVSSQDFKGSSHDKITLDIYKKSKEK